MNSKDYELTIEIGPNDRLVTITYEPDWVFTVLGIWEGDKDIESELTEEERGSAFVHALQHYEGLCDRAAALAEGAADDRAQARREARRELAREIQAEALAESDRRYGNG